jgi:hypothetical protein
MRDKDALILENLYLGIISNPIAKELNLVLEADWQGQYSDVEKKCYTPESVADALNKQLKRYALSTKEKEKAEKINPAEFPLISRGNVEKTKFTSGEGIDVEEFKKILLKRPNKIFSDTEKSLNSSGEEVMTKMTGIPALRGVIYDEQENNFYVINTCKGAGSCHVGCYALKGRYIYMDHRNAQLMNRLQLLINHPDQYEQQAYMEAERTAFEAKQLGKKLELRWNDSGDFFSDSYFQMVVRITKKLQENKYPVKSYAYTKMGKYLEIGREHGMEMTFSLGAKKEQRDIAGDLSEQKVAITVRPLKIDEKTGEKEGHIQFKDLFVRAKDKNGRLSSHFETDENNKPVFVSDAAKKELKERIVKYFNNPPKTDKENQGLKGLLSVNKLFYSDELPKEVSDERQFDVIILPSGDTEAPAQRSDVRFIFLIFH